MNATDTKTGCAVVDQIVTWTNAGNTLNIHEGDLILRDGRFEQVDTVRLMKGEKRVEFAVDGRGLRLLAHSDSLVAVRRYVETEE